MLNLKDLTVCKCVHLMLKMDVGFSMKVSEETLMLSFHCQRTSDSSSRIVSEVVALFPHYTEFVAIHLRRRLELGILHKNAHV